MSDNKLLTENTIRRFMKLANVNSLTDNFISERYSKEEDEKVQEEAVEETEETLSRRRRDYRKPSPSAAYSNIFQ